MDRAVAPVIGVALLLAITALAASAVGTAALMLDTPDEPTSAAVTLSVDADTDRLYKHSAFLVRQDGMTHEEFVDYWQNNHTPIAREIEGVVKYNTVLPADPENAEFDGVAELYFEDLSKLYAALGSEGSRDYDPNKGKAREAREDVDNFLAIDERPRFIGQERLVKGDT